MRLNEVLNGVFGPNVCFQGNIRVILLIFLEIFRFFLDRRAANLVQIEWIKSVVLLLGPVESLQFFDRGGVSTRVRSRDRSFVLRGCDFYISSNHPYSSFVVGLLRRTDWAFARPAKAARSRKGRRQNQVVKNCPGQTRNLVKMEVFVGVLVCSQNLN